MNLKKIRKISVFLLVFMLLAGICCAGVFASGEEANYTPQPTLMDYLTVIGVWLGSMAVGMIGYYLYAKNKRRKSKENGGIKKSRSKD